MEGLVCEVISLKQICHEAFEATWREYVDLIEHTRELIASAETSIGNVTVEGKLVKVASPGETVIIGDLHGDLESLKHILQVERLVAQTRKTEKTLILLGDYGDRGSFSAEVYYVILKIKEALPLNVLLMRGNHEGPDDLMAHPHDLPQSFKAKFDNEGVEVYSRIRALFPELYNLVVLNDQCVLVHGGVPSQAKTIDDLRFAHLSHPMESHLEELLWSDPQEGIHGVHPSPRGAGRIFGEDVTERFLKLFHAKLLIRGHEPSDTGFKLNHSDEVLTLFSRKGSPYFNSSGAYLHLPDSKTPRNVHQLLAHIHQF